MRVLAIIFLSFVLLTACNNNTRPDAPGWIDNPGDGAVGSSTIHVKGRYYQEELAIARARERLAARYGVEISSVQTIHEKVVNDQAYVTSDKQVLQQVSNQTVKPMCVLSGSIRRRMKYGFGCIRWLNDNTDQYDMNRINRI